MPSRRFDTKLHCKAPEDDWPGAIPSVSRPVASMADSLQQLPDGNSLIRSDGAVLEV
jgi:hypothetical protein